MLMQRMKLRIRLANWLNSKAMKMAKKAGGYRKHHHHDRSIDVSFVHPDDAGDGLVFDGRLYENSVVYLGDNAQPSYIDPIDDGCEECGSVGQKIHSQLFKSVMQSDSEEKVFSDSLKKWCQYAAYGGLSAAVMAAVAVAMVYQYAG